MQQDTQRPIRESEQRGVNNLASKLLLALVPPNAPFFRLAINDFVLKDMEQDKPLKTDVEKALGEVERAVMSEVEMSADRVQIFEASKTFNSKW